MPHAGSATVWPMRELVLTSEAPGGVITLTLNRPEKRNALSLELIRALSAAVDDVARRPEARVVILAGAGKSFCAGMDLRGVVEDAEAMGVMLEELALVALKIRRLSVPTIAKVQGAAIGGGCGLMVVADVAMSHPEARLGYPEVDLGVCPAVVAPWLMRKIGAGPARAMLLEGGTMDGEAAYTRGLVDRLVPLDELESATEHLARRLASGGRSALAVTKHWLNELDGSEDESIARRAARLSAEVIRGGEAQARLREQFGDKASNPQ